jgi:hypothetical protein
MNGMNMFHDPFGIHSNSVKGFAMQEEYLFEPPLDLTTDDGNTRDFYKQVCEKKFDVERFRKDGILMDDDGVIIKIKEHHNKLKCLDQMITIFLEEEEYEKCAELRDAKAQLEQ